MESPPVPPVLDRALDLVRFLRARCEWDAAQTPRSLIRYLLEEAHETADAVASGDDAHLRDELGDLLLNVAFQVVLAEERGAFAAEDVVSTLEAKMRRRHPHLYGDGPRVPWSEIKAAERDVRRRPADIDGASAASSSSEAAPSRDAGSAGPPVPRSLLDDVPGLEPLSRAQRIQEKVAEVGFDWPDHEGAYEKVLEETAEVRQLLDAGADHDALEDEIGDLLFAAVNLARLTRVSAAGALVRANAKFVKRFRRVETLAAERGVVMGEAGLAELDELWDEAKRERP